MIAYRKLSNGRELKLDLYFCVVTFAKVFKQPDRSRPNNIFQINRFENGFCSLFIKFFRYSFTINSLKLREGIRYHKTFYKF